MNCIIGIHGGKQSGKDTLADLLKEELKQKIAKKKVEARPLIRKINFADCLKQICIDLFGVDEKQAYGSDDDKNTFIGVYWSDMLSLVDEEFRGRSWDLRERIADFLIDADIVFGQPAYSFGNQNFEGSYIHTKTEKLMPRDPLDWKMTSREFLQFFGTEIMRTLDDSCWINGYIRRVQRICENGRDNIILTPDIRFVNEVKTIAETNMRVNGLVPVLVKLQRRPPGSQDLHTSESGIDDGYFDLLIEDMPPRDTMIKCFKFLQKRGIV